ncbi:hypothetical protein CBS101457_005670 [Exobasidium rhododendri]|nr:hypothetical protein CBS101457_005670 [Exobasidium rhododendri]
MAPKSANGATRRKGTSRETQYKRAKAAEAANRKSSLIASSFRPGITSTKGKGKAKAVEDNPHPFRYKSFNDRLATVHINVGTSLGRSGTGALAGLEGHGVLPVAGSSSRMQIDSGAEDEDVSDDEGENGTSQLHAKTSFGVALLSWKELNLSLPFTLILQQIQHLSLSLPMLLHHQGTITRLLKEGLLASHRDSYLGYEPILDLVPRLANDLGSSFLPSFPELLAATLRITTISKSNTEGEEYTAAMLVERAFESTAATLRCAAPFVLREQKSVEGEERDWLHSTWEIVRPYLGRSEEEQRAAMQAREIQSEFTEVEADEETDDEEVQVESSAVVKLRRGKIPPHTRRFASEALAHLVRRAKGEQLSRIADVMMYDLQQDLASESRRTRTFASGIAGVWVEVAKSIDHRLHSSATLQISAVLTPLRPASGEQASAARMLVGHDIITALVHHGQGPHLVSLFEWLVDVAKGRFAADLTEEENVRKLGEIVSWLIAFVGTRKGKRVDDSIKSTLFDVLLITAELLCREDLRWERDVATREAQRGLIQLVCLSLPLGRIQDLIGPGKKVIEKLAFSNGNTSLSPAFIALAESLGQEDFEFAGFRQIVLPAVMTISTHVLDFSKDHDSTGACLSFLATLQQQGQFGHLAKATPTSITTAWMRSISRVVNEELHGWHEKVMREEIDDEGILASLALVTLFPSHSDRYIEVLCQSACVLAKSDAELRATYDVSPINKAGLLGSTIDALANLIDLGNVEAARTALQHFTGDVDFINALLQLSWHRSVVCSFARLGLVMERKGLALPMASLKDTVEALKASIMSSDEPLRLAAARLLSLAEEQERKEGDEESILKRLVEIEETPLEVETIRERNVRMRGIAREILRLKQSNSMSVPRLELCAFTASNYLVSVFKLNFRPLWEESRKALIDLSVAYGQMVWEAAFTELQSVQPIPTLPTSWSSKERTSVSLIDKLAAEEEEDIDKQFRDPQLAERKAIVSANLSESKVDPVKRSFIESQRLKGRLDLINYQGLILKLFGSISSLSERNNAPLMRHFFETIVARSVGVEEGEEEVDGDDDDETRRPLQLTMMQRRAQLCSYLEMFAQFSNPKALFRSQDLHAYLYELCSQGDNKVQGLALDVVLQWKDPAQVTYSAMLKKLVDQSNFREELTSLKLDAEGDTIQKSHRERLLPLLLRLFFGIMVSKRGRASQGSGQSGRKNAILVALSDLPAGELKPLVDIMLESFKDQEETDSGELFSFSESQPSASKGRQSGYLSLLADVLKHLGLRLVSIWDRLIVVTLNLTYHASKRVVASEATAALPVDRTIRQGGIRRMDDFFKQPTSAFDWTRYMPALFNELISPRLSSLCIESVQSPSALMDLLHTWSNNSETVFYLEQYDDGLLEHVVACLRVPSVKYSVISKVLDIIESMQVYGEAQDKDPALAVKVEKRLLRPYASVLLAGLTPLVDHCNTLSGLEARMLKKDELLRRLLQILSKLSPFISTVEDATALLEVLSPMLRKNNVIVSERSKVDLLLVFERLLLLVPAYQDPTSEAFSAQFKLFSSLLSKLRSRNARLALCNTLAKFASVDTTLARVVQWVQDLNSYDNKRMEEYDFEKRLAVFDALNEESIEFEVTAKEWLPLLHNLLFNLQDAEELAIRANAGSAIRKFIDKVAVLQGEEKDSQKELHTLFTHVVYPGLRRGLRSKSDLVQREVVVILGYAVARIGHVMNYLNEMKGLLVSGDEEASFFNNIYHIQIHRRIRALNRLGLESEKGTFSSRLIVEIFLPLVDQFLNTETHHGDANLIQAAVECLGRLSMRLKWGPYNVLLWKFLSIGRKGKDGEKEKEKEKSDKVCVRAAMSILDHFHFQMDESVLLEEEKEEKESKEEEGDGDKEEEKDEEQEVADLERKEAQVLETKKVFEAVQNRLLPKLMNFLDMKDDLEDTVRLPIAIGVARVLLKLPHPHSRIAITKLLTTMANVFKSKAQDTRDLARVTLGKVALSLGPDYLPIIVKELRRALVRGPQKAVLAFTVHNILIQCISNPESPLTILNFGAADIMDVVMEDVFGQTSDDRVSIENRTTYKEVKAVKSMDTLEQTARIVGPSHVATLLGPIKELMHQTEAVKAVKGMDDCLRRIAAGLNVNEHLSSEEHLLLCYSLLSSNADFLRSTKRSNVGGKKGRKGAGLVLRKRSEVEEGAGKDHYSRNAYKFVEFGLDMLVTGLRKGKFDYSSVDILAKLDPMIGAVGNCLYAQQGSIITASLKALTLLVKCPVPSIQSALPLLIKQTLKIVDKEGTNAQSDILMAALKLLTVLIRDVESSHLQDTQLAQLCRLIDMNLEEEAEMQGVLFGLLRAIIGRKFIVTEVYDVMDKVATIMVTSQSSSIRDLSRSTYLTFLLELPQGQQRFSNQMRFLAKNVNYTFESGRMSILEFLRIILLKMDEEVLREYLNLFFVSLVMCLGNDESSKCKEKAAKLIVQIVEMSREEERVKLVELIHIWAQSTEDKKDLIRISMMIYSLLTESPLLQKQDSWKSKALSNARRVLVTFVNNLEDVETMMEDEEEEGGVQQDWQLPYQALQVISKLYRTKSTELESDKETWKAIQDLLLFPHTWVRLASCRLIGQRLSQTQVQAPRQEGVESSSSFTSTQNILQLTRKMSLMLKSDLLDKDVALQIVKNLLFVGKCFALVAVKGGVDKEADDSDGEEEDDEDEHDWSMENPLRWMFTKLSHQLRQSKLTTASIESMSLLEPSSLLQWFAAMVNHLPLEQSKLFLLQIISPIYRILEADDHLARNNENFASLQTLATEVQELVQKKLGTSLYASTYSSIRQRMAEKRKRRKDEALMLAIQEPEKAMRRKAATNKRKHDSRRRKTQSYAQSKDRVRPLKRQK